MNLPPKTLKQQITRKNHGTAKVPLTSARPITNLNNQNPLTGINSKQKSFSQSVTPVPVLSEELKPAKITLSALQKPLDSLPVLSAFQEFLDNERARTRKRMIMLSISYLLALIIIVSISMVGGIIMARRLKDDFRNIQKEVAKLHSSSLKTQTDADTLSERISTETTRLRTELGSSTDEVRARLLEQATSHNKKLSKMDLLVQSLQKDNAALKDNLTSMQTRWTTITSSLARLESMRIQASTISTPPQIAMAPSIMKMSITPRGQNNMMEWRIPIPE